MIVLVHTIYEGDETVPTLEHRFFGQTEEEAFAVFRAHMKTDSFLRGCEREGHFGDIPCHTMIRVERA